MGCGQGVSRYYLRCRRRPYIYMYRLLRTQSRTAEGGMGHEPLNGGRACHALPSLCWTAGVFQLGGRCQCVLCLPRQQRYRMRNERKANMKKKSKYFSVSFTSLISIRAHRIASTSRTFGIARAFWPSRLFWGVASGSTSVQRCPRILSRSYFGQQKMD